MDDSRTPMPGYIAKTMPDRHRDVLREGFETRFLGPAVYFEKSERLIDFWDKTYETEHKRRIRIAVKSAMQKGEFSVIVDDITDRSELENLASWLINEEGMKKVTIRKKMPPNPRGYSGGSFIIPKPCGLDIEWVIKK